MGLEKKTIEHFMFIWWWTFLTQATQFLERGRFKWQDVGAFHGSELIAFNHQFQDTKIWVEISCFVHFKVKWAYFTEINFWALASSSSKVFLSIDQKYCQKFGINLAEIWLHHLTWENVHTHCVVLTICNFRRHCMFGLEQIFKC